MALSPTNPGGRAFGAMGLALLLGLLGQASLSIEPARLPDGLLLYAVAIALLVRAERWRGAKPPDRERRSGALPMSLDQRSRRAFAALAMAATVVLLAALRREHASYGWAWATWIFAIAAALAASGALRRPLPHLPARRRLASLLGLLVLALLLRLWSLPDVPPTVSGDEASWALEAIAVLDGVIRNPFATGWFGHPTLGAFFGSLGMRLFGTGTVGSRMPWALLGAATVVPAYLLAAVLRGRLTGLLTALLVATWGFHIHFSRIGLPNVADGLFAAGALLCLQRALATSSPRAWAGAGLITGLSLYSYPGARVTVLVVALVLSVRLLRMEPLARRVRRSGVLSLLGVAAVVAAPILQRAALHSDDFNARLNEVGIFQSGWLEREAEQLGVSQARLLGEQLMRGVLGFNHFPDRTSHYGSPEPLLGFVAGGLFLLGLGYATLRARHHRFLPMVAWWWLGILGTVLTVGAPSAARMTGLAVPTAFFAAVLLARLAELPRRRTARRRATGAVLAACIALGFVSVLHYFRDYTPTLVYGNPHAVLATALGKEAQRWRPGTRLLFFGAPAMYSGFPTVPRLAPHLERVDVVDPLTAPPPRDMACGDSGAAFVFLPHRVGELELVRRTFPGGELVRLALPGDTPPALAYHVADPCRSEAAP